MGVCPGSFLDSSNVEIFALLSGNSSGIFVFLSFNYMLLLLIWDLWMSRVKKARILIRGLKLMV